MTIAAYAPHLPRLAHMGRPHFRIAHITPSLVPTSGGPATVAVRLAAAQAARGCDVTIVSSLRCQDCDMFRAATANIPHFDKVRLLLSPWTTNVQSRFGRRSLPIFQSLFPVIDVVHIHGVWEATLVTAAATARRMKIPYVVRPCGVLDPWSLSQRRWKKKLALAFTHRGMLDRAAVLHTLNEDERRLIKPLRLAAPATIIPNGVFLEEIDKTPADYKLFDRFPVLRNNPYVLFLARLHYKKGLDILAEAFARVAARHPNVQLLVAGPDGGAEADFRRAIRAHQIESRVHLPGPLVGAAKSLAFRNAACFCLPSRQEGFSLSVTEAMASRVPVAISEGCHFPEVAAVGAGHVFPLNAAAAAAALQQILEAPTRAWREMGAAGRAYVEENLTWEQIAGQTLETYANLLRKA